MCSARRFGLHDIATHSLLGGQHGEESEEGQDREEKEEEGQEEVLSGLNDAIDIPHVESSVAKAGEAEGQSAQCCCEWPRRL
jgi:hypothetical protein